MNSLVSVRYFKPSLIKLTSPRHPGTFHKLKAILIGLGLHASLGLAADDFAVYSTVSIQGPGASSSSTPGILTKQNDNGFAKANSGSTPKPFAFAHAISTNDSENKDLLTGSNVQFSYYVTVKGPAGAKVKVLMNGYGSMAISYSTDRSNEKALAHALLKINNDSTFSPIFEKRLCLALPAGNTSDGQACRSDVFSEIAIFDNQSFTVTTNDRIYIGMITLANATKRGTAVAYLDLSLTIDPNTINSHLFSLDYSQGLFPANPSVEINQKQADCLFGWGEATFPTLFKPSPSPSLTSPPYYYRFYSQTNAYLGVSSSDNNLYYLGPSTNNVAANLGLALGWANRAGCF